MSYSISRMTTDFASALPDLIDILVTCVDDGASIGFIPPMAREEAQDYWESRFAVAEKEQSVLLIAEMDGRIVGTAQLALESRPNGNHRGDVQKVLVHPQWRRKGIARALMQAIEDYAYQYNRKLLVLDTREHDSAVPLYTSLGYQTVGVIPHFARNGEGGYDGTVVMYKALVDFDK